ncbi:Asp-tRNA(Asn)/Glu-tRNA(Gln) amidotransferase subunit GatB [bacterium]|nr:Asp-tRNA(Asn)/Glu-tRNA(Gln) amidotransferase subunit GatB [bacterium]
MNLETVIGLEIHIQLQTKTKMFCSCSNNSDSQEANSLICPICLGHPGALPLLNEKAVEYGIRLASALNLKINNKSVFVRKNYFYPDLPQGYQISQFEKPLSEDGFYVLNNGKEKIRIGIERLHLENDAAKNTHTANNSLIDFNRAGTPLAEIVTRPDFREGSQARLFVQKLRQICRYLKVSDADMEKGQLRCDVNISLRPVGETNLYPKTEVKNLNSFKSIERAIKYEIKKQTRLWQDNNPPQEQTTQGWNDSLQITELQRSKEIANDYRYFQEPDLPVLIISDKKIDEIKKHLPELADQKIERFKKEYGLSHIDALTLTNYKKTSEYCEKVVSEFKEWLISEVESTRETENEIWESNKKRAVKLISGWIISELFKLINENNSKIEETKITPENMAEFIKTIYLAKVNSSNAQKILKIMFETGEDPSQIIEENDLSQISNESDIEKMVENIIKNNPEQVEQYKNGKKNLIKYFVGMLMKESKAKANPKIGEKLFKKKLK